MMPTNLWPKDLVQIRGAHELVRVRGTFDRVKTRGTFPPTSGDVTLGALWQFPEWTAESNHFRDGLGFRCVLTTRRKT